MSVPGKFQGSNAILFKVQFHDFEISFGRGSPELAYENRVFFSSVWQTGSVLDQI